MKSVTWKWVSFKLLQLSTICNLCSKPNVSPPRSTQAILRSPCSGSLLLTVGNMHCLVILWQKSVRRDKVCPQYRVRNWTCTNDFKTPQKIYGSIKNICSMSPYFFWAKTMKFKPSYSPFKKKVQTFKRFLQIDVIYLFDNPLWDCLTSLTVGNPPCLVKLW